jgi:hypothetical protein
MIFKGKINVFPIECRQTNFMKSHVGWHTLPGIYILENAPTPHPGGGEREKISANVIWGKKNEKAKRKRGKFKEKGRKGKRKRKKGERK